MFNLLVTGDVPGASTYFNPMLQQTIIPCTSSSRPSAPNDGMTVFETDTEAYRVYDASLAAWQAYGHSRRQSYTPVLTAVTTNPTLGTSPITQAWYAFAPGGLCVYDFFIQFGTGSPTAGSGQYLVSLPFTSALPFSTNGQPAIGSAMFRDNSAGAINSGVCYVPATDATHLAFYIQGTGSVTNAVPWTWAASDYLSGSITFPM